MNEIKQLVTDFLEEHVKGTVSLLYPSGLDTDGIELTEDNINNPNKLMFYESGILIKNTLGYSLITGKHLFLPYSECVFVFVEDGGY